MNADDYFWKTKKRPPKTKPRSKPLPKAKEKYLEAEEALFQELEEHLIGSEWTVPGLSESQYSERLSRWKN